MDVVSVGHTSVDRVEVEGVQKRQLGGASIYSALAAGIFTDTGVVSRVGRDFPRNYFRKLKSLGIGTGGIKQSSGRSTYFDIAYTREHQAVYRKYSLGVGLHLTPRDFPTHYLKARGFHIAPMAASKQKSFVDYLREKTYGLISLNTHAAYFSRYRSELLKLISMVDVFTINDEEAMQLTKTKSIEQAINYFRKLSSGIVVITMGVYGSVVIGEDINFSPSVIQQSVVDLTGCGDAYAGSFLATYLLTDNALKAANIANSVASINASDWNFEAIKSLSFGSLESFQKYVVLRQKRMSKMQRSLEHFM